MTMRRIRRTWAVVATALLITACAPGSGAAPAAGAQTTDTVKVRRGNLAVTVSSSGTVQPAQTADLAFGTTGTIQKVFVEEGQAVKQGQDLAALDPRDLDQQVVQAQSNLQSAQAKLEQAQNGKATDQDKAAQEASVAQAKAQLDKTKNGNSTEADLASASAAVRNAQANLQKAQNGNNTAADVANAQAAVRAAQAALDKTRTGSTTPADIANAQAAVRAAEAGLQKTRTGNTTPADIANAQAGVRGAEANLQKVKTGNTTPADIANAQAAVQSAQAKLAAVKTGPTPDLVSAAQTKLTQAQQNYQKTAAADSSNKTSAQQSMYQAADGVRTAQTSYTSAYYDNQNAQNGTDPKTGKSFSSEKLDTATQQQQYANALQTATLALSQAQSKLEQAKVAFQNAQQQEINDDANAQAQVTDAQVQLNQLLKGPKDTDVAQAQAAVDQANAQLAKLQQGGSAADV
nr:biotin/lipoyl-binding protein [Herpetosiphonaceae bacterium]